MSTVEAHSYGHRYLKGLLQTHAILPVTLENSKIKFGLGDSPFILISAPLPAPPSLSFPLCADHFPLLVRHSHSKASPQPRPSSLIQVKSELGENDDDEDDDLGDDVCIWYMSCLSGQRKCLREQYLISINGNVRPCVCGS